MLRNKEIAQILNISPAAVSLALNNKHGVSEEKRRRVFALRNSSVAADFTKQQFQNIHSGLILFVVFKKHGKVISDTPFFMSLSESLHQQTSIKGFGLQVSYFQPGTDLQSYLLSLEAGRYEGILLLGTEADAEDIRAFLSLGKPLVVIDGWFPSEDVNCVLMDNEHGILQAVCHAYEMGHRRIGYLNSSVCVNNFKERFRAYRAALARLDLPYEEKYVFSLYSQFDGASEDMRAILNTHPSLPSVFVCANDLVALGAMDAATRFGLRVPDDLSFIGFDDMPTASHMKPALTSIRIYYRKIAATATALLADKISEHRAEESVRCLVHVDLIRRESVLAISPKS